MAIRFSPKFMTDYIGLCCSQCRLLSMSSSQRCEILPGARFRRVRNFAGAAKFHRSC